MLLFFSSFTLDSRNRGAALSSCTCVCESWYSSSVRILEAERDIHGNSRGLTLNSLSACSHPSLTKSEAGGRRWCWYGWQFCCYGNKPWKGIGSVFVPSPAQSAAWMGKRKRIVLLTVPNTHTWSVINQLSLGLCLWGKSCRQDGANAGHAGRRDHCRESLERRVH